METGFPVYRFVGRSEPLRRSSVPVFLTLYVILLPVQFQVGELFNFAPSDAMLLAYILLQPNRLRFRKAAWSVWHALLLPMMLFSAWIGVGQTDGGLTEYVVVNKLMGALWLLVGYGVFSGEMSSSASIRSLARSFVASVTVVNFIAIAGYFWPPLEVLIPRLNYSGGSRAAGFLIDPNAFGGLVLTALVLQAVTALCKSPLFRGFLSPLICTSLAIGLGLTFSRSAWIGLAAALILLGVLRPVHSLKMAVLIAGSGLALLVNASYKGLDHFYAMAIRPGTIESRLNAEGAAFSGFLSHPVLGTGLGTFLTDNGLIIHNTYLWFLSECGVVGAIVVLGLTLWFFRVAIPLIRSSKGTQQGLIVAVAVAHAGMIGVSFGIEAFYQRHWWLIMAMIAACRSSFSRPRLIKVWLDPSATSQTIRPVEAI